MTREIKKEIKYCLETFKAGDLCRWNHNQRSLYFLILTFHKKPTEALCDSYDVPYFEGTSFFEVLWLSPTPFFNPNGSNSTPHVGPLVVACSILLEAEVVQRS